MNKLGIPESEHPALVTHLCENYRYEDGHVVNRRTGHRRQGSRVANGYLSFSFGFKGGKYCTKYQRIVWTLCHNQLPITTIDHINGNRLDNRIENLREVSQSENNLNTLLPWRPNKDTGVPGVSRTIWDKGLYGVNIRGKYMRFSNPYEAFYWAIACGKRYRES